MNQLLGRLIVRVRPMSDDEYENAGLFPFRPEDVIELDNGAILYYHEGNHQFETYKA